MTSPLKPLNQIFAGLFDDPDWSEAAPQALAHDVVSDLLPWRLYDAERELYINEGSTGFLLEIAPQVNGMDVSQSLTSVIQSRAPREATIQILNWTSPDIDDALLACLQVKRVYCSFNGKLARVFIEGLRAVEGRGFGSPRGPDCAGATVEELEAADLERIDLSEAFADMTSGIAVPGIETIRDFLATRIKG